MNPANHAEPAPRGSVLLAGLQAGVLGALAMLAWLGVSSVWQRRSFWTAANLMATCFSGDGTIPSGFTRATISGIAVYVLIYGALGAIFAAVMARRASGLRLALLGMVMALAWYYLTFGLLWRKMLPLVWLFHPERSTIVGHLLYGGLLGRVKRYLPPPAPTGTSEAGA